VCVGDVGVIAEDARCLGPARYNFCAMWLLFRGVKQGLRLLIKGKGSLGSSPASSVPPSNPGGHDPRSSSSLVEDESSESRFVTAFITVTQHFGKGMRAAPDAKMDDGLMDLLMLEKANRAELFSMLQLIPNGSFVNLPGVRAIQTTEVFFTPTSGAGVINVDGENVVFNGTIRVKCLHKVLPLFVPADCPGPQFKYN